MMKPPADSPEQTCLPDTALDNYALGRASEALAGHVEAHTAACKNCEQRLEGTRQEVAWIRALLTRAQQPPGDPAACLDDGALALFIDGAMAPGDHEEAERHLAQCMTCRNGLVALHREVRAVREDTDDIDVKDHAATSEIAPFTISTPATVDTPSSSTETSSFDMLGAVALVAGLASVGLGTATQPPATHAFMIISLFTLSIATARLLSRARHWLGAHIRTVKPLALASVGLAAVLIAREPLRGNTQLSWHIVAGTLCLWNAILSLEISGALGDADKANRTAEPSEPDAGRPENAEPRKKRYLP